jgi:FAD/FMN-containing dehydrogenase
LPCAGSTDAQSLGGLLATDLHGTGRDHGFLSEQVLEVRVVKANGDLVTITRTENGFRTDEQPARTFEWLPVAGALGMLGVVVEVTLLVDTAYHLAKAVQFVDRRETEERLDELLEQNDHLSFYYPGGVAGARTVRMNTWNRTDRRPSWTASLARLGSEISDHALVSFAPGLLFDIGRRDAHTDDLIRYLNRGKPTVLPAPAAFARRLFFVHDEIEYGFPRAAYPEAIRTVMDLLAAQEVQTIVEVRFTPDRSTALLGPGTAGRGRGGTAYIELATPLGMYSDARIAQVYEHFDRALRPLGARPHLGKKTAMNERDMAAIYGDDWGLFQGLRREWDPTEKFLPADNLFLRKVFGAHA